MGRQRKAVGAGYAHGSQIDSAGVDYCPPQRKLTQRERLLAYLQQYGSITTAEARDKLRMMSPASRVLELREAGHAILQRYDKQQGCGRYHLIVDQGG